MKKYTFKTRHALLMSMISLMTCFAMLLGSTFAWFTDSVTSGVNRIVSGNLDVELYHKTTSTTTDDPGDTVNGETKLFTVDMEDHNLLWEPEVMAYETFTIRNAGTLNLKYELHLNNIGENNLNGHKLADVIKALVVDEFDGNRLNASAFANAPTLATFVQSKAFENSINANDPDQSKTIVLYWPESSSDNDYNVNNEQKANDGLDHLYVDLGITLVATQETGEYDSFNDQYDATSTQPSDSWAGYTSASAVTTVATNKSATLTAGAAASNKTNNTTVEFTGINADENTEVTLTVETSDLLTASGNFTATNDGDPVAVIDLSLTTGSGENASAATFDSAKVTTYITAGIDTNAKPIVIQYTDPDNSDTETWSTTNGNADYNHGITYDSATGALTFKTTHFSEYVVYNNVVAYDSTSDTVYSTLQGAINEAESGDTIVLLKDVKFEGIAGNNRLYIDKDITLDGNNKTVTAHGRGFGIRTKKVTFKDIIIVNSDSAARCIDTRGGNGYPAVEELTLNNVTLSTPGTNGYLQPLTIGGSQTAKVKININNSCLKTDENGTTGYTIITFNPVDLTIRNSEVSGWAALYMKGQDSSQGSSGSTVSIYNSRLYSYNKHNGATNSFGTIVLEDANINILLEDCELHAHIGSDQSQDLIVWSAGNTTICTDSTVTIKGKSTVTYGSLEALGAYYDDTSRVGGSNCKLVIEGGVFNTDPTSHVDTENYTVTDKQNGTWSVAANT